MTFALSSNAATPNNGSILSPHHPEEIMPATILGQRIGAEDRCGQRQDVRKQLPRALNMHLAALLAALLALPCAAAFAPSFAAPGTMALFGRAAAPSATARAWRARAQQGALGGGVERGCRFSVEGEASPTALGMLHGESEPSDAAQASEGWCMPTPSPVYVR